MVVAQPAQALAEVEAAGMPLELAIQMSEEEDETEGEAEAHPASKQEAASAAQVAMMRDGTVVLPERPYEVEGGMRRGIRCGVPVSGCSMTRTSAP